MTETPETQPDAFDEPADDEFDPEEIEDDPAYNPDDDELEQIKGG